MFSCCQRRGPGTGAPWLPASSAPPVSVHPMGGQGSGHLCETPLPGASSGQLSGSKQKRVMNLHNVLKRAALVNLLVQCASPEQGTKGSLCTWPTPGPGPPKMNSHQRSSSTPTSPGHEVLTGSQEMMVIVLARLKMLMSIIALF